MSIDAHPRTDALPWVVTVLNDPDGAMAVIDPSGLTPADVPPRRRVSRAAGGDVHGVRLTWAWGRVDADAPTPRVWFAGRLGVRRRRGDVRRLSPTLWAAQVPGRWTRVRVR